MTWRLLTAKCNCKMLIWFSPISPERIYFQALGHFLQHNTFMAIFLYTWKRSVKNRMQDGVVNNWYRRLLKHRFPVSQSKLRPLYWNWNYWLCTAYIKCYTCYTSTLLSWMTMSVWGLCKSQCICLWFLLHSGTNTINHDRGVPSTTYTRLVVFDVRRVFT